VEFTEVLEHESELTRKTREKVRAFEERAQEYLDSLLDLQDIEEIEEA